MRMLVVHSRDHEAVGMAHKITLAYGAVLVEIKLSEILSTNAMKY